jgi:hypothetical protein
LVVGVCNPSTLRLKQEDGEFETSMDYIVRPCRRKTTTKKTHVLFIFINIGKTLTGSGKWEMKPCYALL